MKIRPRISIIIPVYNVEKYIEKCINSIKAQTFYDFEAIVVNDGSQDSSIDLCKSLIDGDARFTILHKENGGLMSAWKYGLTKASGDYIGFVDSDDWIDTNMFDVLYKEAYESSADVVISGYVTEGQCYQKYWTRDKKYIFEGDTIKNEFIKDYCCSYFHSVSKPSINRWDKLYKRKILIENMDFFNEKVSLAEDFNANIPVFIDAKKIVLLPNYTPYHYRFNPNSIVNTFNKRAFSNIRELSLAWKFISKSKCYKSLFVDSFIGNIVFEEINKICSMSFKDIEIDSLIENLKLCDGFYYLDCYARIRDIKRIYFYNWLIQHGFIRAIKYLVWLNKFRP